jgi:hypothetical protein
MQRTGIVSRATARRGGFGHERHRLLFAAGIVSALLLVSMLVDAAVLG